MTRPAIIPAGSWPRRMSAELAAAYCGESSVDAFIKRVGSEYPQPRICEGRRRLWKVAISRGGQVITSVLGG